MREDVELAALESADPNTRPGLADLRRVVACNPACRELEDPDVMFPHPVWDPDGVIEAQNVCARCAVRQACLELAQRRGERHGVWGGRLFTDPELPAALEELEAAS